MTADLIVNPRFGRRAPKEPAKSHSLEGLALKGVAGHRCGYLRHNGKALSEMTKGEQWEQHYDLSARCCHSAYHHRVMEERWARWQREEAKLEAVS